MFTLKKILSVILAVALVFTTYTPATAAAASKKLSDVTESTTFKSSECIYDTDTGDRLAVEINGKTMTIDFSCSAENPKKSEVPIKYRVALTEPVTHLVYGKSPLRETIDLSGIENGKHYLMISRATCEEELDKNNYGDGSSYRAFSLNVKNGKITIDKYENIMANNKAKRERAAYGGPKCHLDPSMKDMDFLLTDYNTKDALSLTTAEQNYIKKVSDTIVKDAKTDYDKARAIYEYIGEHVFYDVHANEKDWTRAYLHPYRNLRAIEEKEKYPNSDGNGHVATLCTGYSALTIALMRAQGIPARLVYGYHLNTSDKKANNWEEIPEQTIKTRSTHYWVDFYADGKWMTCDSYMAGANKWERSAFNKSGTWNYRGFTNYAFLNPSEEQMAVSHYTHGIFTKSVMANNSEVKQLKNAFLANGNYKKLGMRKTDVTDNYIYLRNPKYTYTETKGDRLQKIDWQNRKVAFNGNLKNLSGLKWLNINNNPGVKYLTVSNDKQLTSAYASDCNIKSLYALNCPKLNAISAYGNPLTLAKYSFKGSKVATVKANKGGVIRVAYKSGKHKLTAVANKGYIFTGWYNKSGKRVSQSRVINISTNASFERNAGFRKTR